MKPYLAILLGFALSCASSFSAEPEAPAEQLPRLQATEAKDAFKTFRLKQGFHVELAAAEPEVADPVSMSFDANGRLYVVEMIGYSERRADKVGRVRLLEDTDGDGRFEKATVFAAGLAWPTAVICYDGGVFVVVTPDLLYFRDTDDDGVADQRRVIFTGFGKGRSRLNMQALPNSLRWGLDNRIHGATSSNGAVLTRPDDENFKPVRLNGRDFSFDPRKLDLRAESGGGQHGASFDDYGRRYVSSNSNHLQAIVFEARYAANSRYAMPNPRVGIAADGSAAEVYRISPDEPWRIVRTRWRLGAKVRGPVEGGGRVSGYFTAATGVTIYRGDVFGADYVGNAFVADAGSNLVHRKVLHYAEGIVPRGERPVDERKTEFLVSTDNWFRPVQLANGPDGCLYVLDMYREVIEHPWSLPQGIKKHLDLNSGNDRGRVWRIVPNGFERPTLPRLGDASLKELVSNLSSPNAWLRVTSSRLLFERRDPGAAPDLSRLLAKSTAHLGRLHALYALAGLGRLETEQLIGALGDKHPVLREHALKLSEPFLVKDSAGKLAKAVLALSKDASLRVRFQLALTLGVVSLPNEVFSLLDLLEGISADNFLGVAVVSALSTQSTFAFSTLREREADAGVVVSLATAMQKNGSGLKDCSREGLRYIQETSAKFSEDTASSVEKRLEAARLLATFDATAARKPLLGFLDEKDETLRFGALQGLIRWAPDGLTDILLPRWKGFSPRSRDEALGFMLKTNLRTEVLLAAIEDGGVAIKDLSASRLQSLRTLKDLALRTRAVKLVGPLPPPTEKVPRAKVIESYLPSLKLPGVASRGRVTYGQRCASCHRAGKEGFLLGPDLVTMKAAGLEKLLTNLVDPSREVAADFVAYEARTTKETFLGLLANETPTHLTVRFPFGKSLTLERKEVRGMKSLGRSIMPEGLEVGLDHQAMADLLAFLTTNSPSPRLPPFDLLVFRDAEGREQPVRSKTDWGKRRTTILQGAEKVMGAFPRVGKRSPLNVEVVEETEADSYVRRSITYLASSKSRVPAHLCIPKNVLSGKTKAKAILCLHPTDNKVGRKVVLGLGGRAGRAYAAELAERGFVTISPAYPLLADYQPDPAKHGFESGTMMAIWDNSRALDLLESLPYVDSSNGFGVIGHSLGGHNAIFTAAFEKRISAVAVSCSFDSFPDYYDGNEKNWVFGRGWCQTRYMPLMADYKGRLSEIPFDFPELLGALAPRRVFISAPKGDSNFRWKSTGRCSASASKIYSLLKAKDNLLIRHPECGHDFPKEIRDEAYTFLADALSEKNE